MNIRLWILTTVAVTLLAGCSRATSTTSAGDCEIFVKTAQHGTYRTLGIYAANDSLDPPIDTALISVCEDTGRDARGPVFTADSPSTEVSPVPGVAHAKALFVKVPGGTRSWLVVPGNLSESQRGQLVCAIEDQGLALQPDRATCQR